MPDKKKKPPLSLQEFSTTRLRLTNHCSVCILPEAPTINRAKDNKTCNATTIYLWLKNELGHDVTLCSVQAHFNRRHHVTRPNGYEKD